MAYRGVDSRIYQLVDRDGDWLQQDLTLTLAAGDPYGFNYYAGGPGSREARAVVYRDVDSHIDVVGRIARMPFDPFEGTRLDLTDTYGAPLAAGDPVALERWPLTGFIVFYRGAASHIYSIKDGVTDLTDAAGGAPLAAGDPIVYVTPDSSIEPPGLLHVVYRGTDSEGWRLTDLTETAAHPPQAAEFALIA